MFRGIAYFPLVFIPFQLGPQATAGEVRTSREFDQNVMVLQQGSTVVKLAPDSGLNVYSIEVDGVEFLHQPASADRVAGVSCGVPILYPTPNRVKGGKFSFQGKEVQFSPLNGRGNHIHGLVNRQRWEVLETVAAADFVAVTCEIVFSRGNERTKQFPFAHRLLVQVKVSDGAVEWSYTVDNSRGTEDVPFGFALHPYFIYQGERAETYLTIPASHWMESLNQLPTGKLIPASELEYSLGKPLSLESTKLDDVFWGMTPDRSTLIDFRDQRRQVRISASEHFTHLVVWTPDRPFFGIESQTCSTDAHNLHSQGKVKESHLQIARSGETLSGWVQYRFLSQK